MLLQLLLLQGRPAKVLTMDARSNYIRDGLLDARPVVLLGDDGGRLVDAGVAHGLVGGARDVHLARRVADDLLALERQDVVVEEPIVRRGAAEPAFLGAVRTVRVAPVLEVVLDLVEALFTHEKRVRHLAVAVGARAQVSPVYDGVHEPVRVRLEVAAPLDAPDALEPQGVPDPARHHVGLVHQVEHGVGVAQLGRPVEVRLAHEAADAAVPGGLGHEEPGVAHVAAAAGIVGLDVEASQTLLGPVLALNHLVGAIDAAEEHDAGEVLEPVGAELLEGHRLGHGVGVAALDFLGELVREIGQERGRHLIPGNEGNYRGDGLAVSEGHLARNDVRW